MTALSFAERMERLRENRRRFEVYLNLAGSQLPAPVVVATDERVYVTVTDTDDLVHWMAVYGGYTHRGPEFDGMQTWTLHQVSDGWSDGRVVPVQITAVTQVDEPVMHDLIDALAQAPLAVAS